MLVLTRNDATMKKWEISRELAGVGFPCPFTAQCYFVQVGPKCLRRRLKCERFLISPARAARVRGFRGTRVYQSTLEHVEGTG